MKDIIANAVRCSIDKLIKESKDKISEQEFAFQTFIKKVQSLNQKVILEVEVSDMEEGFNKASCEYEIPWYVEDGVEYGFYLEIDIRYDYKIHWLLGVDIDDVSITNIKFYYEIYDENDEVDFGCSGNFDLSDEYIEIFEKYFDVQIVF